MHQQGAFMKLYLVHCGFYDADVCQGLYESHVNFFVVGESFEEARLNAKNLTEFKTKRMHIDGLQEISVVQGHEVQLQERVELGDGTVLVAHKLRELAPKPLAEVNPT
jgi:hypothetical protein